MPDFYGLESLASALSALLSGTTLGFFFGLIPGLGGRVGLIISLPLAAFFPPYEAAIFLFSLHSVINTSGAIPNIAFGIPSSSSDMATIIDGYPLAKKGRAGEALGASLSASAIGGGLGALAFLIAVPIARPLVTSFGPPEFFLLAVAGLTMVASLSREGLIPGLAVGGLGILVAMVGLDDRYGSPRFTFGSLELLEGVSLPALVCGLFVVPEMLSLTALEKEAHLRAVRTNVRDVFRGMFVTLNHLRVVWMSSIYGIVIGLIPAMGSSISVWMSYDYAARTTKSEIPFGEGAIAGVIAPEAANNSKEGGSMIPTLFFGIPGSSGMAIMMGALAFVGVAVGPNMLGRDFNLSFYLAATVLLSNLVAVPLFFLVIPSLVRMAAIRREAMVPFAIIASVTAALIDTPRLVTIILIAAGAVIGIALKRANWPRAPFILGYVIGDMAETSFFHTVELYGWQAFQRPMTLVLAVIIIGWTIHVLRSQSLRHIPGPRIANIVVSTGMAAFFGAAVVLSLHGLDDAQMLAPVAVATACALLCLLILGFALASQENPAAEPVHHVAAFALFLLAAPFIGIILASCLFTWLVLLSIGIKARYAFAASAIFAVAQFAFLNLMFEIGVEREIVGRIAWSLMGY